MIDLDKACEIAYKNRDSFKTAFEVGIWRAFDRVGYWVIDFDYVDFEKRYTIEAFFDITRPLFLCVDKQTGDFINGGYSHGDAQFAPIPGGPVEVPDKYYRVPWYGRRDDLE